MNLIINFKNIKEILQFSIKLNKEKIFINFQNNYIYKDTTILEFYLNIYQE